LPLTLSLTLLIFGLSPLLLLRLPLIIPALLISLAALLFLGLSFVIISLALSLLSLSLLLVVLLLSCLSRLPLTVRTVLRFLGDAETIRPENACAR